LVPGAEADRGGLVAGHALLPRPGGEGLAGGGAGRGMEGTEIGDDLLLGAAGSPARAGERGLGGGARGAQPPAHLLLGQAQRRAAASSGAAGWACDQQATAAVCSARRAAARAFAAACRSVLDHGVSLPRIWRIRSLVTPNRTPTSCRVAQKV